MNETTLLARVQSLLDARRDPLDDGDVVAALQAHPEWLERFAGLRADALVLATLPAAPVRRPRRWPWILSACFAAAAAALVVVALRLPPRPRPAGRILAASLAELRPGEQIAATFAVKQVLLTTPTTRLETWQTRSEVR